MNAGGLEGSQATKLGARPSLVIISVIFPLGAMSSSKWRAAIQQLFN